MAKQKWLMLSVPILLSVCIATTLAPVCAVASEAVLEDELALGIEAEDEEAGSDDTSLMDTVNEDNGSMDVADDSEAAGAEQRDSSLDDDSASVDVGDGTIDAGPLAASPEGEPLAEPGGGEPLEAAGTRNMHRLYNPNSGEHFYTASTTERDALQKAGWRYEGVGWVAPSTSKTPVYRLYNRYAGDHHYTTSASERDSLRSRGWSYEGVGWYSDDARAVRVYRQYNPRARSGSHNYTTSKAENDALVARGWRAEGVGWYAVKAGDTAFKAQRALIKSLDGWWAHVGGLSGDGKKIRYRSVRYVHNGIVDTYDGYGNHKSTFKLNPANIERFNSGIKKGSDPGWYLHDWRGYRLDSNPDYIWTMNPDGSGYSGTGSYRRIEGKPDW